MAIGIYGIFNTRSPGCYVGQSYKIFSRLLQHLLALRDNSHPNLFQTAWNEYGEDDFRFVILEICPQHVLSDRENYWINLIGTYNSALPPDASQYPREQKVLRLIHDRELFLQLPEINKQWLIDQWIAYAEWLANNVFPRQCECGCGEWFVTNPRRNKKYLNATHYNNRNHRNLFHQRRP